MSGHKPAPGFKYPLCSVCYGAQTATLEHDEPGRVLRCECRPFPPPVPYSVVPVAP